MRYAVVVLAALWTAFTLGCEKTTTSVPAQTGTEATAGSREAESTVSASRGRASVSRPASDNDDPSRPLAVAYSYWNGWTAWKIGIQKGWFASAGVRVAFEQSEHVPAMEAFAAGKVDAVTMTNADALVTASVGAASIGILLTSYSSGNHRIIARPGVNSVEALTERTVGVELGFIGHLLLLNALEKAKLSSSDVSIVNIAAVHMPGALNSGSVHAVAAWQPLTAQVHKRVPGSTVVFTSAESPGFVYELLYVSPRSLAERRNEWVKVAQVWMRITEFVRDERNWDEAVGIMASPGDGSPASYKNLLAGTRFLDLKDNIKHFAMGETLASVHHSSRAIDRFNVANKVYKQPMLRSAHFDASVVRTLDSAGNSAAPTPAPTAVGNE